MSESVAVIDIVAQVTDETGEGAASATRNVSKLEQAMKKVQEEISKMKKMSKIELTMYAIDKASGVMQGVWDKGKSIAGKVFSVTMKAVDLVTAPVRGIIGLLKNPIVAMAGFAGIGLGLTDTLNTFADFEAGMSRVKSISGATGNDFEKLVTQAKELGATTAFNASEVASGMENLASAGFETAEIMAAMSGMLDLAASSGEDLATSAGIAATTLRGFGLDASEAGHVADVLAKSAAATNASVASTGEAMKYIAPVARNAGWSLESVTAAIGVMADSAIEGSQAGTTLRSIVSSLNKPSKIAAEQMKSIGFSAYDTNGKMKSLSQIITDLKKGTAKLSDEERNFALTAIFGTEALAGMQVLMDNGSEKLDSLTTALENSDGAASGMAKTMQDNLKGSLEELGGAAETLKIGIGEKLTPYIRKFADWLTGKMPQIEAFVGNGIDFIVGKIESVANAVTSLTHSPEWQNAETIWDKIKVAWDKLIVEPFEKWWNGSGKAWLSSVAQNIGRGLGGAIKSGLSALFGLDASGIFDDGIDIAKSFTKGFTDGIDGVDWEKVAKGIGDGLVWALKTAFSLAYSNPVTGTLATAFIASKVLGGVGTAVNTVKSIKGIGGALFGTGASAAGGAATKGLLSGVGTNAILNLGIAGEAMGSGAASVGGLAAAGAAGIAGGVVGGVTLISAGSDFIKSLNSDNKKEKAAYGESAAWKAGGVAAGAAVGAAIGTVVPVIGTAIGALVGAGVGGIAGWIQGDKALERYEKEMQEAEEATRKLKIQQEQAKYSSSKLKNAVQDLADGYITAEGFMAIKQEAITESLEKRFGIVKLSIGEIQSLAEKITFGEMKAEIDAFTEATGRAENSFANLKITVVNLNRLNWKATIGIDYDPEEYQQGIEAFIANAKDYVESRQYEITTATKLFLGDTDMTNLNGIFARIQGEIDELGGQLTALFTVEGELDVESIAALQNQIAEKISKISAAEYEGNLSMLKVQFGGEKLSLESFNKLQTELEKNAQTAKDNLTSAFSTAFAGLELELSEGIFGTEGKNSEAYKARFSELEEAYKTEMSAIDQRISDFLADEIGEKFGLSAGELTAGMQESLKAGISPTTWTEKEVSKFLGLSSIESEAQEGIAQMIRRLAQGIPALSVDSARVAQFANIKENIDNAKSSKAGTPVPGFSGVYYPTTSEGWDKWDYDVDEMQNMLPEYKEAVRKEMISQGFDGTNANGGIFGAYANGGIADKRGLRPINQFTDSNGVMGSAHVGLVGEDGAEAIIPLSANRRERGLALWEKAGQLLGAKPYANGGLVGLRDITPIIPTAAGAINGGGMVVPVTVQNVTFDINVNGNGETLNTDDLVATIKENVKNLTDEIAYRLAESLQQTFANTPLAAWGV